MTSRTFLHLGLVATFALGLGCSDDPTPATDAATDTPAADTGPAPTDTGTPSDTGPAPTDTGPQGDASVPTDVAPVDAPPADVPAVDAGPACPLLTPDDNSVCPAGSTQRCEYPGVVCGPGMRHFNTATCTDGRWRVVIDTCPPPDAGTPSDAPLPADI